MGLGPLGGTNTLYVLDTEWGLEQNSTPVSPPVTMDKGAKKLHRPLVIHFQAFGDYLGTKSISSHHVDHQVTTIHTQFCHREKDASLSQAFTE